MSNIEETPSEVVEKTTKGEGEKKQEKVIKLPKDWPAPRWTEEVDIILTNLYNDVCSKSEKRREAFPYQESWVNFLSEKAEKGSSDPIVEPSRSLQEKFRSAFSLGVAEHFEDLLRGLSEQHSGLIKLAKSPWGRKLTNTQAWMRRAASLAQIAFHAECEVSMEALDRVRSLSSSLARGQEPWPKTLDGLPRLEQEKLILVRMYSILFAVAQIILGGEVS